MRGPRGDDPAGGRRAGGDVHAQQFQRAVGVEPAAGGHLAAERGDVIDAAEDGVADLGHRGVGVDAPRPGPPRPRRAAWPCSCR